MQGSAHVDPSPAADPGPAAESRLALARRHPGRALAVLLELARGALVRARCRLLGKRVRFGRNLRLLPGASLSLRGPGRVVFGDDVLIAGRVTPWTDRPEALIEIGNRVLLSGTRMGCQSSITIGDRSIIGECRIMDSDYHGTDPRARDRFEIAPVQIGADTWIAVECIVLKGVRIGDGTTVATGSVVVHSLPANSVCGGNPARVLRSALTEPEAARRAT